MICNLMKILEYLDEAERRQLPVTEEFIKKLHFDGLLLRLSDRSIREKVSRWKEEGFIETHDLEAKRVRSVKLTEAYEQLAQEIRKAPEGFPHLLK